ncbi:NUDIX hydrolase [Peptacetobacter hiranonis]|uniref:Mutator MutT protein n=1 Tax=Peptacetobacter hiranonis (strain DSM 13275 / JCM 10541 / KCTC 15199 / TO-931) TaxID=500633 RepID=B6G196_PEPHT|nr:8-oxo-dGTP diphosphatase [Peptacetobacter hiranonis]EEA84502.1 mutator MutT protein [Peptacetobacter hiranonis DSM 13275]QEK21512.1 8-oxo-dGTP diphosphatase [Peptacetobacter hiranonis]
MNKTVLTTICYIEKGGKTLMLYRNKKKNDVHEGKYVGIGGKFEFGETPEECIIREIKEETGLTVNSLRYHGLISFPKFANDDNWYMFIFSCRDFEGEVPEDRLDDCPEGRLLWVDNDKVMDLNMWDGDRVFLEWVATKKVFNAKIEYKEGILDKYHVDFY